MWLSPFSLLFSGASFWDLRTLAFVAVSLLSVSACIQVSSTHASVTLYLLSVDNWLFCSCLWQLCTYAQTETGGEKQVGMAVSLPILAGPVTGRFAVGTVKGPPCFLVSDLLYWCFPCALCFLPVKMNKRLCGCAPQCRRTLKTEIQELHQCVR